jgi:triacylglycerol lipase
VAWQRHTRSATELIQVRVQIMLSFSSVSLPVSLAQFIGLERLSTLREVVLMPRDLATVVPDVRPGDDVVVLVHGFFASAGVFRPLRKRLEREAGARVATFTHPPYAGVRRIARRLGQLVDQIPRSARVTIVGHSLGGVAARWYVQEMAGHTRVSRTVSLASPFHGIPVPQLLVGADLHRRSELLRRLRERCHACSVSHTSVVAAADSLVVGVEAACLGFGDVIVLPGCGHNSLLFHPAVAGLVIEALRSP